MSNWKISIPYPFTGHYRVSQHFGENAQYYSQWNLPGHNGIDFATPTGTPILAVAPGIVTQVRNDDTGYGHHVRVVHTASNGKRFEAIYGHFSQNIVQAADENGNPTVVQAGTVLGLSGNTGNSTGPHLHFEIRPESEVSPGTFVGGAYAVDPEPFFMDYVAGDPVDILYSARVLADYGLVIRSQPYKTDFNRIGINLKGAVLDIVEEETDAQGNLWVRINSTVQQWSCWAMGGVTFLEKIEAVDQPDPPPVELTDKEKLNILWAKYLEEN